MKYHGYEKLKASGTGGTPIYNDAETAKKFGISYQQARNYTIKYEEKGMAGIENEKRKIKWMKWKNCIQKKTHHH